MSGTFVGMARRLRSASPLTLHVVLVPFHLVGFLTRQLTVPGANLPRTSGGSYKPANDLAWEVPKYHLSYLLLSSSHEGQPRQKERRRLLLSMGKY